MHRTNHLDRISKLAHAAHVRSIVLVLSALALLLPMVFAHGIFAQSAADTTFTPTAIPISAPEIANPGRGLHRWNGMELMPVPMRDIYRRQHWSQVETAPGVYNFDKYDSEVRLAEQRGMRLIIGLPQPTGATSNDGSWVPADLTSDKLGAMDRGSYHPNFNNPVVLNRWKAMIDTIAQRYGNDDRVSGIELCIIGAYGEWYFSPTVPDWVRPSEATTHTMIDYVIAKFPSKQLYMMISSTMPQATIYALQRSPRMGLGRMALGDPQFERTWKTYYSDNPERWNLLNERWKTAPLLTETNRSGDSGQFAIILDQVQRYHVSLIGNGNFDPPLASTISPPPNWTAQQLHDFQLAGKLSGYRYILQSLRLSQLIPGRTFEATSSWANVGVTPVYEPWKVHVQLRNASDAVVFDSASALDLRTVLPTEGKPVAQSDTWTLPSNVAPGTYRVHVVIPPLNKYVPALQLAINGQRSDGSYYLGDVAVTSGSSVPASVPTATSIPSATSVPIASPTTTPQTGTPKQTVTFVAEADARIAAAHPDTNYGKSSTLRVDGGSDPEVRSYLRFNVHDLPSNVISATLRIYATSGSTNGPSIYGTTDDWTETGLTWDNRSHRDTKVVDDAAAVTSRTWITYDVTRLVKGNGQVSVVLVSVSNDGINIASRETTHQPQLLVTTSKP